MGKTEARKTLAILLAAAAVYVGYVAITVPLIAMTGPLVLAIALGAGAWFAWPRSEHEPSSQR